jgi:hypothetical protein
MRQGHGGAVVSTVARRSFITVDDRLVDAAIGLLERVVVGHIGRSFRV